MGSQNQERYQSGTLSGSELNCPPISDPEFAEVQSSDFDVDAYTVSSAVFLGTQGRSISPIELEMEKESSVKCKRLRLLPLDQQGVYLSVPESSSPLGLRLRKTPSFLDLVETKLSHPSASLSIPRKIKSTDAEANVPEINSKTKASNFSASLLRIGSWERLSRYDGELVAKCYFAKRKLVWEVLDSGLKKKIEVPWSDIAAIKANCESNAPQTLEIELFTRPLFFRETDPQPRKHTLWKATGDFTNGQASIFRRHLLQFPQGTLQKHYEKLLQLDDRLYLLSKKPYPSLDSAFFGPDNLESQNPNDHKLFGLEGQSSITSKGLLKSGFSDDYSELLHCFTLSRTTTQKYSNLHQTVASSDILSPTSGTSEGFLGHGTSISTANILPSVLVSLPPFLPNFNASNMIESYCNVEKRKGEVKTDLLGSNLGATGLHIENLNSKLNFNSTLDFKPNCWISEIQTDHNLSDSTEDIGYKCEIDEHFSRFSYLGEVSGNLEGEISGNCAEFLANISGTTPFPVFVVEDNQAACNEVGDSPEWTLWT